MYDVRCFTGYQDFSITRYKELAPAEERLKAKIALLTNITLQIGIKITSYLPR